METSLRTRCEACGHTWSFHGKRLGAACKAMGCKGGPDGCRCEGFVDPPVEVDANAPKE